MTQYADKVEHRRKLSKLEEWRKKIKYIISECKTPGGVIEHRTVYNDGSELIEYLRSKRKNKIIESPHTEEELLCLMGCEKHDWQRKLSLTTPEK